MDCPSPESRRRYVAGELSPAQGREIESHLIACAECRAGVLALREVAPSRSQPPEPTAGAMLEAAPAGRRHGFLLALVASVAGLVGVDLLLVGTAGFSAEAVLDACFELVFLLRSRAPGLVELLIALAATASLSALGSFGLSLLLRRLGGRGSTLALVALALLAEPARALEKRLDQDTHLAAGQRVEGSLLASGERIEIDGVVAGHLFAAADRVVVRGSVEGDLFVFSEEFELRGRVEGNLIVLAERSRIEGRIEGSAYLGGDELRLAAAASIDRDLWLVSDDARVEAQVGRDLSAGCKALRVDGGVGRNLRAWARELALGEQARVAGGLEAWLPSEAALERAGGARIGGETRLHARGETPREGIRRLGQAHFWLGIAIRLGAAFVTGLLLHHFLPQLFAVRLGDAGDFFRCCGVGLLVLLATPVLLLLIGVTLVGLPVALAGAFAYVLALYVGGLLLAAQIGTAILPGEATGLRSFGRSFLLGLLVLAVLGGLPLLGGPVRLLTVLAGLGLLAAALRPGLRPAP